ncbi:PAS domain S-box protein [Trinickia caryophylli]|uniref:histidine kinase n=1 Tax=Trinickia caryophylli TaxID=28094 RepID=A0A1X7CZA6_TRICW|nr:PAS domain S-box protein [Trinickia caryophylli]PMS13495.1 PAS domain S-box protein [Trinickia caryophylli]TRX11221.1 PAS domain S-box protein [Trinickia caryophylli]WQE15226.1 PAS domain S-box protein [Trinickia caryophylli]SMF05493.1 PAS domain S-box-containing protein [Trinickia caryophylli]GLU31029.1 histidine kinase [Trinickia caryophylli]
MANAGRRLGKRTARWIDGGVALVGVLMLVTAAIGALGTISLYDSEAEVSRTNQVGAGLERLLSLARDAETGARGYVITGRDEYLEPYEAARTQFAPQFAALAPLLRMPEQKQRLAELRTLVEHNQQELERVITARRGAGFDAAHALVQSDAGKTFMDRARQIVGTMERAAGQQLVMRQQRARKTRDAAIAIGLASGFLTIVVCVALGYLTRRLVLSEAKAVDSLFDQKELLDVVLSGIGDGVIATDLEGRVNFFNAAAAKLTGWSPEEAIGKPIDEVAAFIHGGDKQKLANPALMALTGGAAPLREHQTLLVDRAGRETHVDAGAAPSFDVSGRLIGAVLVMRDVSDRERADERFRLAVEAAPNAMIMVDQRGRMTLVNSQTEKLFGYAREELIGQSIDMLVPDRFRATHAGQRQAFVANAHARPMGAGRDLYGRRRDGSEFPVEIGLNPLRTAEGMFVLSAIADITERKRAETELRQRTEELARSNRDLEQFAYVASHDLQEPLRAVAGPLQLLQRRYQGQLDARADEFITHAVDGATRMQSLIDDLLSYSRVGRLEDPAEPTESAEALERALRNLSVLVRESGAQITHDSLPRVRAIPTQLTLLMQNLIGNALKFRSKERTPTIHIGATRVDEGWQFAVKDNGIGIEPQYFERIFLIFQRLHTRREYAGTGLGLALCKRIVEHHGGRIWLESTLGEGTTFFFTLREPLEPAHQR